MAEEQDKESQTEEATEKKLTDAIERGVVPVSREVSLLASLACLLIVMVFVLRDSSGRLVSTLIYFVDDPAGWRLEKGADAIALGNLMLLKAFGFVAPIFALFIVAGIVASVAQNTPRFVLDRILPDFSRISPRNGLGRIFGLRGLTEFLKSVLKFGAVGAIVATVLNGQRILLVNSMFYDVGGLPERILNLALRLVAATVVATLVVAAADIVWARIHWLRGQRMSRQEIKDEIKQMEGDRLLKARLRSIRLDRSRKRMLSAVPRATMVVVNPTHYAVALRYVRSEGGAPIVVAKGLDLIALKIREIAEERDIPLIEDKPLARSLYDSVKVDTAIPPEFYRAIAELIHLIQQKKSNGWPIVRDRRTMQ
jgi:flagellar biosynthetic protein FlhB